MIEKRRRVDPGSAVGTPRGDLARSGGAKSLKHEREDGGGGGLVDFGHLKSRPTQSETSYKCCVGEGERKIDVL